VDTDWMLQLPAGFESWPPVWQAATLFLTTFVLEDVAAIGGGLTLAAGGSAWPVVFWPCFLGIWLGDVGLYALARRFGRTWFERSRFARHRSTVARSEQWFARRGTAVLIFSRVVPGARLPTYLAAGFLRLPISRFLFVTGVASLVWTVVILIVVGTVGAEILRRGGSLMLLIVASLALVIFALRKVAPTIAQWRRWEFWPPWLFYIPVTVNYLWLAIKYRSFTAPTAANPGMFSGGIVGESKAQILDALSRTSPEFMSTAELLGESSPLERIAAFRAAIARRGWTFPVVLKPNVGQRGIGVKVIRCEAQAIDYLQSTGAPLIVQRYAPGPREVGIFYYRMPGEGRGRILAITEKIFPAITGDGRSTIAQLIGNDARARFMSARYLARFADRADEILGEGQVLKLVETGNHAQGCIFQDGMHLLTPDLAARIDEISRKLPGFHIGRYDVRYESDDDLRAGRNFQIVELNGAAAEATSIYDARNSLWSAYRTLFRQWELVFAIGAANLRRGNLTTPVGAVWNEWRKCARQSAMLPTAD
jgi:membrane protein DedA with SNARE-associated domain